MGVVQDEARGSTTLDAARHRSILNHPQPYPRREEEATEAPAPSREPSATSDPWRISLAAISLLAVDPRGLGGLRLAGPADPARERLIALFAGLLPEGAPVRRLPAGVGDARLLGGLDLAATLAAGRPVAERGLLAETDGGALVVPSAERTPAGLAGRLALALDRGAVGDAPAGFCLVACDEATPEDEPPPAALTERLGLVARLSGVSRADLDAPGPSRAEIAAARARLAGVTLPDAALEALAEAALRLGVFGLRPLIFARAAACASAALAGRGEAGEADLALAARLVLGPRATSAPAPAAESPPEPETPDAPDDEPSDDPSQLDRDMAERVLEAAAATLPAGLLDGPSKPSRAPARAAGGAGAVRASKLRGRPAGARAGSPGSGARLDLIETLRAAAPWQGARRREREAPEGACARPSASDPGPRILVRREDFRVRRLKERRRSVTVFAVDASGSAALHRLAEAKGAVELLLAQSYVRRDEVALVAFRGTAAEILLPPTRSLARARRALAELPGGGGTPLASGLDMAAALAERVRRRGDQPLVVLLTDGAANVARDGTGGRARAGEDATASARMMRALALPAVLIDVSPRPAEKARALAQEMAARYVALPAGDAASLARAARSP